MFTCSDVAGTEGAVSGLSGKSCAVWRWMEVFDRVALLPGEQLIAPHLERFPGLKTLRLAFYQVASATLVVVVSRGGGGGAVNQVKPREQVVGRVATMSLSGLVGASAAGYARHSADAGARCCASGRLGMAAFKQSSVGGVSSTGGVGGVSTC